jgi:hypothetical protein
VRWVTSEWSMGDEQTSPYILEMIFEYKFIYFNSSRILIRDHSKKTVGSSGSPIDPIAILKSS